MNQLLLFLLTIGCALLGAFIADKLKLPTPYMLGSMVAVAALTIITNTGYMPSYAKQIVQGVSGAFIALGLSRKDIQGLKQMILPAVVLVGSFMIFTGVMGLMLHFLFGLDQASAFLVSIPGGVSEISLMAAEFGAEPATVSFIQTFRLFTVYLIFPPLITYVKEHRKKGVEETEALVLTEEEEREDSFIDRIIPDKPLYKQLMTVLVGQIGGFLGKISGLPAGTLSFAMIAVLLYNLNSKRGMLDRKYRRYCQVVSGALIGRTMTLEMVLNIPKLLIPTIALMAGYVCANFIISTLLSKTKKIDFISAMFASSPGGASDMALIAAELGGESPKIAILQIIRLLSVYIIFPLWSKLLVSIFIH